MAQEDRLATNPTSPTTQPEIGSPGANEWSALSDADKRRSLHLLRLTLAASSWAREQPGQFRVADMDRDLRISPQDRRVVINALMARGDILPVGQWRGVYRVARREVDEIEWRNPPDGDFIRLRWPLALQNRLGMLPGSLAVVAGESNAGKTAFLLAMAAQNSDEWPEIRYLASSNESNALTLRRRIDAFGLPDECWANFRAIRPRGEFADAINPNGLNLIDYLEVHEDFYLVGAKLAEISERLENGIAIVGLQKSPGNDFGRGGAMTMEKSVAYVSLIRGDLEKNEPHTLKFLKIKYPAQEWAHKPIKFKLIGGHDFRRVDF